MRNQAAKLRARGAAAIASALLVVLGGIIALGYFMSNALAAPTPPPPAPTITGSPALASNSTSATFTYSDSKSGASFRCSLDSASFGACGTTGVTYTSLAAGTHSFSVASAFGNSLKSRGLKDHAKARARGFATVIRITAD